MANKFALAAQLRFLSIEEAKTPPTNPLAHVDPIISHYWLVHPTKGLVFYQGRSGGLAPQANPNPLITQRINDSYYPDFKFKVVKIDMAWIPTHGDGTYKLRDE